MLDKAALFIDLVRSGTLHDASVSKGISVSTASRWIKQLEDELNVKLIIRESKDLTLTQVGKLFYEQFSPIVDESDNVMFRLANQQFEDRGHISVMSTPIYTHHFLVDKLSHYMQLHPNISIKLEVSPWGGESVDQYDITISASSTWDGCNERVKAYVRRDLVCCPFKLVGSPAYLHKSKEIKDLSDIKYHRCVFATSLTGGNDWIFSTNGDIQKVKIPKTFEINDVVLLLKSTLNGVGISYLPSILVDKYIESKQLVHLLPEHGTSEWRLSMYYRSPLVATTVSNNLKEFLINHNDTYLNIISSLGCKPDALTQV